MAKATIMKVSIITVCFNEENTISDTCESIVCQTFKDFEWIVVDGGSTDKTLEVLNEYRAHMAHLISEKDRGIYDAMNKGVLKASGTHLLFLNGGDALHDPRVLHDFFADDSLQSDIIYGHERQFKDDNAWRVLGRHYKFDASFWIFGYHLRHQATFIRRDLFKKYGMYNLEYRSAGDYEMFLRFIHVHKCSVAYKDRIIDNYRFYNGLSLRHAHIGENEVRRIQKTYFSGWLRFYYSQRRFLLKIVASLTPFRNGRRLIRSHYKGEFSTSWNAPEKA